MKREDFYVDITQKSVVTCVEWFHGYGGNGGQQPRTNVGAVSGGDGQSNGDDERQTQPPMGGNADGPADGVDFAGLSGLGDTELEEIREWMVKGTNRTDELRMCGNGVVPQTAERALRVLYAELTGSAGAGASFLNGEDYV